VTEQSLDQLAKHRYDPGKHCLAMVSKLGTDASSRNENVEASCAFEGRARRDVEEAATISRRALSISLRDVVRNGLARVIQVLRRAQSAAGKRAFERLPNPRHKGDAGLVNIEPLVIEESHTVLIGRSASPVSRFFEHEQEHEHEQVFFALTHQESASA
jgi:hypothetical protein